MSKKPSFPMVVKLGSARVTIYRNTTKKHYASYTVRYCRGTEEVRETRALFDEALDVARSAARNIANGEMDVLTLRNDDRLSYVRSVEHLRPTGVSLESAAVEYAKAHELLRGASLLDAVQFYARYWLS